MYMENIEFQECKYISTINSLFKLSLFADFEFNYCRNALVLIFCWPVSLLVKDDAAIFGINVSNHSQGITRKAASAVNQGIIT